MNKIEVGILYRDGQGEVCYVTNYGVENNCLKLYRRNEKTRYIPIDTIKEWQVTETEK